MAAGLGVLQLEVIYDIWEHGPAQGRVLSTALCPSLPGASPSKTPPLGLKPSPNPPEDRGVPAPLLAQSGTRTRTHQGRRKVAATLIPAATATM